MGEKLFNNRQEKEVCKLYKKGNSINQLGRKFNCSESPIRNILIRNHISRRTTSEMRGFFNDEQEREICKLYLSGNIISGLGKKFDCSACAITNVLKRNKIIRRATGPLLKFDKKQEAKICKLYLNNYTIRKLGKIFNCGSTTILYTLMRNKISRRDFRHIRKRLILSEKINSFITGDLLSDAHAKRTYGDNNSCLQWKLKYKDYAEYLISLYEKYFIIKLSPGIHYDKTYKKWRKGWYVRSEYNLTFTEWRKKWYPKGIKIVPRDLVLTPKICLNWYLGDGSLNKKNYYILLCTHGFIKKDVDFLIEVLWRDLKIKSHKSRRGKNKSGRINWAIYISRVESKKFLDYIGPCPVKCYKHKWNWKIPMEVLRRGNNKKIVKELFLMGMRNCDIARKTKIPIGTIGGHVNLFKQEKNEEILCI